MNAIRRARALKAGQPLGTNPQAVVLALLDHIDSGRGLCPYCCGSGGWEAVCTETAHEWRECRHCHGTGLEQESR